MCNPNIQNDFSFYRRSMAKMKNNHQSNQEVIINDDLANKMSLFYAYPTPLLRTVIESTSKFMKNVRRSVLRRYILKFPNATPQCRNRKMQNM